ncbi:MAG: hypothetical protein DME30_02300 [Verrucomicrobia bacterium]|nr:MAG: hypothetical protein DME30_02300 [Verrucomicrobiota bacterium]
MVRDPVLAVARLNRFATAPFFFCDRTHPGDIRRASRPGCDLWARRTAACRSKAAALENVRVVNVESSYAVRYLLPEASVETFYLLFPDPWPKRRHHRRRIVRADFLDAIHRALADDGFFRIATDQLDYFEQICGIARNHSGFAIVDANASPARTDLPLTKFERRFRELGAPIYRLALRKISPVR